MLSLHLPTSCKLWDKPHYGYPLTPLKKRGAEPWAVAPVRGTEQHQWLGTWPLRFQLLPWLQDSLPKSGQARPPSHPRVGRQPAWEAGEGAALEGLANGALELGHSSQSQSQGEQMPWMESGPEATRQSESKQLTGRAEPTTKVGPEPCPLRRKPCQPLAPNHSRTGQI